MAEYTNFNLKKFLSENKLTQNSKVIKEAFAKDVPFYDEIEMSSVEVDGVDTADFPDFSDSFISYAEFKNGTPLSDEELDQLNDSSAGMELAQELAHDSLHEADKEETVSELDGSGSVDALTAILGAGGLTAGAFALNKIMDALEAGKLGDKGKAVAKHLRDMGNTFSKGGAPMMEETTVELTKEEAFKKQITDILLSENKSTANSKVVSERKRNIFGMETEGFGDKISNAVSGIGAKISGGNAAILQKAISASGLKVGTPLYSNHNQWDASHNGKVVYTIEKIDYKTGEAIMSATVDGKDIPRYTEEATKGFTKNLKDIINAEPEKAQQLANEFIQGAKEEFSKGKLSYKPIQSK